jgi:hypothetical protein
LSFYSDAMAAIRSIVLIDERMNALSRRLDDLTVEVRHISTRLTRLETIVEIARPDGSVLRVAPDNLRATRANRRLKE